MRPIGGYFELELTNHSGFPHYDGVLLNSGRNALEYVFRALGDIKHLYVPYYTCDVVMEPIEKLNISYTYYHINQILELDVLPTLNFGDYLIYTNYFGIKDEYVKSLAEHYGSRLIVDNAQAWFAEPIKGINTFYSPRKYVGVPDGGVAYCSKHLDDNLFEQDYSYDRCAHLLKRIDLSPSDGYADFKATSKKLVGQPIKRVSTLTKTMLASIDFEEIKNRRLQNYNYLHKHLCETNLLHLPMLYSFACPMVYLYMVSDASLKQKLIEKQVFVPTYWPNVLEWCKPQDWEYELAEKTAFIPIDQRYGIEDMQRIIAVINNINY